MPALGIDTSNYTTSVAVFDGVGGENIGSMLRVREGELGLRQSDALFQHVRQLPALFAALREKGLLHSITAVAASTRPRQVEGSYMPCFLPGESMGRALADALDVPFYPVSHQQGHIAAAAWSAGRMDLLETPHLAWHLSGGTTELLLVTPRGPELYAEILGGSTDISAGQLIDRTGKLLGLPFPAGKALDALAEICDTQAYPVKIDGLTFSLSGMENKVGEMCKQGVPHTRIATFVLATVCGVISRVTDEARALYPALPVVCSGGVASSHVLRAGLEEVLFAVPEFATDNAMGAAILAYRNRKGGA
ncbi:MAG: DNA-binding protein [Oscillospiraceae bacterium]|nr:DNA-binding protein [Oscillospiraceae bacterium]